MNFLRVRGESGIEGSGPEHARRRTRRRTPAGGRRSAAAARRRRAILSAAVLMVTGSWPRRSPASPARPVARSACAGWAAARAVASGTPLWKKRPSIGKPIDGLVLGMHAQRDAEPPAEPRKPVVLAEVEAGEVTRLRTGSDELDRVLGGGLVPGSVVLIGGSPGIGKSTLMSAALASIQSGGGRPLYVSGEESAAQVKLRAERLGPHALAVPVLAETSLEVVLASLEQERPQACVIDSVQTLWSADLTGAPGSVGQVQEVAARARALRARARLRHDPRRPRHEGRDAGRARACSSTPSIACCSSRASASAASAPSARSRTASVRRTRSACSRCAPAASTRSPILPSASCATPSRCRAPAFCVRWRAPGPCWSRSRRWSPRPTWSPHVALRTASTATGSA